MRITVTDENRTDVYDGEPADDTYVGNVFPHGTGFAAYRTPLKGVADADVQRDAAGRILVFDTIEDAVAHLVPDAQATPPRPLCTASNGGVVHNAYCLDGVWYPCCRTMGRNNVGTWYVPVPVSPGAAITCTKCIRRTERRRKG